MRIDEKINFLRFLTLRVPMSVEDLLANGLMRRMSLQQVVRHIRRFRQKAASFRSSNAFNLYIHVPFCDSLCSYCHCNRVLLKGRQELSRYVGFLTRQINTFAPLFQEAQVRMLCFGGGTPSLFECADIVRLLDEVENKFLFADKKRIMFEGNPSSLTAEKLKLLKSRDVERVSIGVQSLDPVVLREIDRRQTRKDVFRCLSTAKRLGFPFVNVDLVAGLPKQTGKSFSEDLKAVIREGADIVHVNPFSGMMTSAYARQRSLNIKALLKERHDMMREAKDILEAHGFKRTGLEAYSRKEGGEAYQELSYTQQAIAVLGIGAFAKSHLPGELVFETLPSGQDSNKAYFVGHSVSPRYAMAQYVTLRLVQGMKVADFRKVFGQEFREVFKKEAAWLMKEGLISEKDGICRYKGSWSLGGLFDYFSYTKILFGQKFLGTLRKRFASEYDLRKDYGGPEHVLQVYQNSWISTIYYQMGI